MRACLSFGDSAVCSATRPAAEHRDDSGRTGGGPNKLSAAMGAEHNRVAPWGQSAAQFTAGKGLARRRRSHPALRPGLPVLIPGGPCTSAGPPGTSPRAPRIPGRPPGFAPGGPSMSAGSPATSPTSPRFPHGAVAKRRLHGVTSLSGRRRRTSDPNAAAITAAKTTGIKCHARRLHERAGAATQEGRPALWASGPSDAAVSIGATQTELPRQREGHPTHSTTCPPKAGSGDP